MNTEAHPTPADLLKSLALVTDAAVFVDHDGSGNLYVLVTAKGRDDLAQAAVAVGSALENAGMVGRRSRVNGSTVWSPIIGAVGGCKGYRDGYRCGFERVRVAA